MTTDGLGWKELARALRHHWAYLVLLSLATAFLISSALIDHTRLNSGYDLGIYDQVVWNIAHGRLFETTLVYETNGTYDHFEPVLLLIAPLYWLFPDVRVLLIIQSIALALGSLPVYLYARHRLAALHTPLSLALLPVVAFLLYPPLHAANLNDFHEVGLLPPLLGMALYGLLTGRRKLLWVFLGLSLLVKEDVTVTVLAFGLYIAAFAPTGFRRRDGIILAALAVVWGALVLYVFYPAMTDGMPYPFVGRRYSWLGGSPDDAVRGLAAQPLEAIARIMQPPKLRFLLQLFAPLLFLPLLGWPIISLAVPVLIYLMLSDYPPQWSIGSYYNPPLLAILFFAMLHASAGLARRAGRWGWQARPVLTTLLVSVLVAVVADYVLMVSGPEKASFLPATQVSVERARAANQLMSQIPPDAAVSTEWVFVPHLSQRRRIYTLLARPVDPPEYRIVELRVTSEGSPIFPFAAAEKWPPVYYEYEPIATAGPFELSKLKDSYLLEPLPQVEPRPLPVELAAYGWLQGSSPEEPPRVKPGEKARLMLAWRRTDRLDRRYVFFVHVLREGGPEAANGLPGIVAQSGHEPGKGDFPTTLWETWTHPGIVLDEQAIKIPAGTEPGTYYVWAGAFDKETGDRIELGGSGKTLRLVSTLVVQP